MSCHNRHPDSPKRDWKVGDVRGIEEFTIIQPIAAHIFTFKYLLLYFAFVAITGLAFIGLQHHQSAMIARFKIEGFQHSRVMETLAELTDTFGGRLRGSPAYAAAADWAKQRLNEFGIERVAFEPGGFPGPGWVLKRFSVSGSRS